jgi:hypothetical protein
MLATTTIDMDVSASAILGWNWGQPPAICWTLDPGDPTYVISGQINIPAVTTLPRLLTAEEEVLVMASLRASSRFEYAF